MASSLTISAVVNGAAPLSKVANLSDADMLRVTTYLRSIYPNTTAAQALDSWATGVFQNLRRAVEASDRPEQPAATPVVLS